MSKLIDLTGQKFGRLTVLKRADDYIQQNGRRRLQWLCECSCDNKTKIVVSGENLKGGKTKSCGCLQRELTIKRFKKYNTFDLSGEYGIGYTSSGKEFWFDKEFYDEIKDYCWHFGKDGYVQTHDSNDQNKFILLSRLVMGFPEADLIVDHKRGKTSRYDNRKCNLRVCTKQQNNMNRGLQSNNTSGVTGVKWNAKTNKWIAHIAINKNTYSKSFENFDDAVAQRKKWEYEFFGEFSYDNSMRS